MAKLSGAVNDTQKKIAKQAKLVGAAVGAAAIGIGIAGTMAFVDFEKVDERGLHTCAWDIAAGAWMP
jgi:hypothetical protein